MGFVDAVGASADDGDELDLPVDGTSPDLDVVDRTGQGNGNFVKVAGRLRAQRTVIIGGFIVTMPGIAVLIAMVKRLAQRLGLRAQDSS